jgi:hypothetical protein
MLLASGGRGQDCYLSLSVHRTAHYRGQSCPNVSRPLLHGRARGYTGLTIWRKPEI